MPRPKRISPTNKIHKTVPREKSNHPLSALGRLIGIPGQPPRSKFRDMVSYIEGLKKDPWLAISQIALIQMMRAGKWWIEDEKTGTKMFPKTDAPPVVQLFMQPNPDTPFRDFLSRFMIHRNIKGEAFVAEELMSEAVGSVSSVPTELWNIDPALMTPVTTETELIAYWEFKTNSGSRRLEKDIIHMLKFLPDPDDPRRGIGIVELGETHFNITTSMEEWVWSLFVNGQIPDGIITMKGEMDDEVLKRTLMQFQERFGGARKAHKPLLLEEGATYTPGGGASQETDFMASIEGRRITTLALGGVAPIWAGLTENTNFASAFISDTVFMKKTFIPTIEQVQDLFTEITRRFGNFVFRFQQTRVISDPASQMSSLVQGIGSMILTPNEAREERGMERVEGNALMDQHFMSLNLIPAGQTTPPPPPPQGAPPATPEAQDETVEQQLARIEMPFPTVGKGGHIQDPDEAANASRARGTALQQRVFRFILAERRHIESLVKRSTAQFMNWQMELIIDKLMGEKAWNVSRETFWKKSIQDFFDSDVDEVQWRRTAKLFFSSALREEFAAFAELWGIDPGNFGPGMGEFEIRADRLASRVTGVTATTREKIAEVVNAGLGQGFSPSQLANGVPEAGFKGIRETFASFTPWRSQLIARTESVAALDQSALASYARLRVQVVDVVGCEDFEKADGQKWGCNSKNIPIAEADAMEFHPNHKGAFVPQLPRGLYGIAMRALTRPDRVCSSLELDRPLSSVLA